jgi:hypothetical protein
MQEDKETMDKFEETLNRIDSEIPKMQEECRYIRHYFYTGSMEQAYASAFKLAEISEKVTLETRALPRYTGNPNVLKDLEKHIENNIPVEIGFTKEGWFSIRIPRLLPRKGFGSADYIRDIVWLNLRKFFKNKPTIRYPDCVLIYRHIYGREYNKRYVRDHDNIETYMISDMIALYVLRDDNPYLCNNYDCTAEGVRERTEVYVVPKAEFLEWLDQEKTMPKEGVRLYETKLFRT